MTQTMMQASAPARSDLITQSDKTARMRELNDTFRSSPMPLCGTLGRKILTSGIRALGGPAMVEIVERVMAFNDFSEANDPWGEHDFGALDHGPHKIFWKIDYYDRDCVHGSPDPSDAAVTCRVLTILLAAEY